MNTIDERVAEIGRAWSDEEGWMRIGGADEIHAVLQLARRIAAGTTHRHDLAEATADDLASEAQRQDRERAYLAEQPMW